MWICRKQQLLLLTLREKKKWVSILSYSLSLITSSKFNTRPSRVPWVRSNTKRKPQAHLIFQPIKIFHKTVTLHIYDKTQYPINKNQKLGVETYLYACGLSLQVSMDKSWWTRNLKLHHETPCMTNVDDIFDNRYRLLCPAAVFLAPTKLHEIDAKTREDVEVQNYTTFFFRNFFFPFLNKMENCRGPK